MSSILDGDSRVNDINGTLVTTKLGASEMLGIIDSGLNVGCSIITKKPSADGGSEGMADGGSKGVADGGFEGVTDGGPDSTSDGDGVGAILSKLGGGVGGPRGLLRGGCVGCVVVGVFCRFRLTAGSVCCPRSDESIRSSSDLLSVE
jgi:hypothetical protein